MIPAIIGRFMDSFRPHAWWSLERSRAGCGALLAWRPVGLVGSCAVVDQLESPRVRWRPPYLEGESFLPAPAGQVGGPGWVRRSTATMPQPRSGALRVAAGQLIWSSHPAPAARDAAPGWRAPWPQSPRPPITPSSHRRADRGKMAGRPGAALLAPAAARTGTGQPRQPQARCRRLAYLPAHRQPGRPAQPARPAPGKPAQRTTAHRQHRTLPPDPAPQATRPGPSTQRDLPRVDRICR